MLGTRARDIPAPPAMLEDGPAVVPARARGVVADLTPREREVLLLIARGYSNAEIAEAFVVSEGTVKTHVKRILAKLDVRDRTQAAILAFDSGFVTPEMASEPEPR
ncbi:MAG: DNA-binding response regulator [Chloroflexi bacterium]|nr:DNA-binding response regulator [Chloroflexota bacterium]MQC47609.1 DNA-binding response regulator [Chloroflexota bacterium]